MSSPFDSFAEQSRHLNRRTFLTLSAGLTASGFLAACGGSSQPSTGSWGTIPNITTTGDLQIAKRFPEDALVPGVNRLPISLADTTGLLADNATNNLPDTLTASVIDISTNAVIVESVIAKKHGKNLATSYYPFLVTLEKSGIYVLKLNAKNAPDVTFQIHKRSDVFMPVIGEALPGFDTPTIKNNRGVNPICTRTSGTCPFHQMTVTEALQSGKPLVYLIGTPAFCKTGTCSPALEGVIDIGIALGDTVNFVHAEVYADKTATEIAPAVKAYNLSYEPVLYITDNKGILRHRLDAIFDVDEVRSVLAAVGIN